MPAPGSYPHADTGPSAAPPLPPTAKLIAAGRALDLDRGPGLRTANPWRLAGSLEVLRAEADAANPDRDKASDGTIGDAAHAKAGRGSDHNAWVTVDGTGVVRALDLDVDGLDLPAAVERARVAAAEGRLPQLTGGGYIILNRRITAPDFSEWRAYTGPDPHTSHAHFSVSTSPGRFDDRRPWGILAVPAPVNPDPVPAPAPAPAGWTGPDLTGEGPNLRGEQGCNGPRVAAWQTFLRDTYPAYRHALGDLAVDGWWGPVTSAWNREFGQRSGIPSADGLNIGPKLAAAYYRAGLFRTLSAARARVAGHLTRTTGR